MNANSTERLHALDATRAFVLLLGIAFHATMSFLPSPVGKDIWIVEDNHRSLALALVFFTSHMFRMMTFFMIAGFFGHMSFHKKGAGAFIRDRLKRIGIPLVASWPIIFALIVAVTIWGAMVMAHGGKLPKAPAYPGFPAFPLTHLWFLYVLLMLYAATLILRGAIALIDRSERLRSAVDAVMRGLIANPFGFVLLAAPTALVLTLQPSWLAWFGIPTPDSSLVPNAPAATAFATAFAFGWLLHRQTELLEVWRRRWFLNLALAIGFTALALSFTGPAPVLTPASHDWQTAAYAASYMFATWTWTFAIIGLALRFLSNESAARRYIANSSYWLYLVHLPLIMALQIAVSQLAWPWEAKFLFILGVGLSLMFASYQLFVRYSFIGAILNGRRERPSRNMSHATATREPAR